MGILMPSPFFSNSIDAAALYVLLQLPTLTLCAVINLKNEMQNPNEDTEWNDILRSKGILPPKEEATIEEDAIVQVSR